MVQGTTCWLKPNRLKGMLEINFNFCKMKGFSKTRFNHFQEIIFICFGWFNFWVITYFKLLQYLPPIIVFHDVSCISWSRHLLLMNIFQGYFIKILLPFLRYDSKTESIEADVADTLGQHLVEAHWKYFTINVKDQYECDKASHLHYEFLLNR